MLAGANAVRPPASPRPAGTCSPRSTRVSSRATPVRQRRQDYGGPGTRRRPREHPSSATDEPRRATGPPRRGRRRAGPVLAGGRRDSPPAAPCHVSGASSLCHACAVDADCVALLAQSERLRARSDSLARHDVALSRACATLLAQAAALCARVDGAPSLPRRSIATPQARAPDDVCFHQVDGPVTTMSHHCAGNPCRSGPLSCSCATSGCR